MIARQYEALRDSEEGEEDKRDDEPSTMRGSYNSRLTGIFSSLSVITRSLIQKRK
jgi:hypothetical protein